MSLWTDSATRSSSYFPSRPVYLRSATTAPLVNRPANPKPLVDGPHSPPSTLPPVLHLDPQPLLPSSPIALGWHPPSPAVSDVREPAMAQVLSFVHPRKHQRRPTHNFSAMRVFHDITPSTHDLILRRLECKLYEDHPKVRIDYFGDHSRLVITIPGDTHETVADSAQSHLRRALFDQGFYWPGWGGSIDCIQYTGSADRKFTGPDKATVLQPDGSLKITGQDLPFLVIEVADAESYQHARTKGRTFLMGSKGKIRFVILIDLLRKTRKEIANSPLVNDDPASDDAVGESSRAQPLTEGNKRAAEDSDGSPGVRKRTRTASPSPPQSPTLPLLLPAPYSRATVTVLTTSLIDHPKSKGKKLRTLNTLIDAAECWPAMPAQDVCFTFSWDDMNVTHYPPELRERKFTVRFDWLHETMQRTFGVFQGFPIMRDDSDEVEYEVESEPNSADAAMERERMWAVEAKVDSGKIESDDSWK